MKQLLDTWRQRSEMLAAAREARRKPPVWSLVPIALLVFLVGAIAAVLCAIPLILLAVAESGGTVPLAQSLQSSSYGMLLNLAMTLPITAAFLVYLRAIEGRSWLSIGFRRRCAGGSYLAGYAIGIGACLATVAIAWAAGGMRFEGLQEDVAWGMLVAFFLGFLFQGMSEEVVCRGFLLVSAANRAPLWAAVALNTLFFACLHLANAGLTWLSFVNLVLFGVFASFYMLRTDNIWGIGAFHAAWNFTQGNLLGIEVSGNPIADTLFRFAPVADSPDAVSGGSFGLEGGLAATAVFLAGILLLAFWPAKQTKTNPDSPVCIPSRNSGSAEGPETQTNRYD